MISNKRSRIRELRYELAFKLLLQLVGTWKGNDSEGIIDMSFELADAFIDRMFKDENMKIERKEIDNE